MGKFLRRLTVIGAAVGGVIFFWRRRQAQGPEGGPAGSTKP
jgi:hypothetical protein